MKAPHTRSTALFNRLQSSDQSEIDQASPRDTLGRDERTNNGLGKEQEDHIHQKLPFSRDKMRSGEGALVSFAPGNRSTTLEHLSRSIPV
jgi:hypothetical protein